VDVAGSGHRPWHLPRQRDGHASGAPAETTEIAPTILALLGLNPSALDAVRIEYTRCCPASVILRGIWPAVSHRPFGR
jgi:hypothetical protein